MGQIENKQYKFNSNYINNYIKDQGSVPIKSRDCQSQTGFLKSKLLLYHVLETCFKNRDKGVP